MISCDNDEDNRLDSLANIELFHNISAVRSLLLILIRPDLPSTAPTRGLSSPCKLETKASEFSRYL